jgi:hypothetical protein
VSCPEDAGNVRRDRRVGTRAGARSGDLAELVKPFAAVACFWMAYRAPAFLGGRVAEPTRENNTEVFYGPCRGGDPYGCGYDVSVRSTPSCERPYSLYTTFTGPPGEQTDPPKLITLRGVPAAVFDDRIELWTRDSAIVVFATPKRARQAVEALRPVGDATPGSLAPLPPPAGDIVSSELTTVRCAA